MPKIKGTHAAMKSGNNIHTCNFMLMDTSLQLWDGKLNKLIEGILAADTIVEALQDQGATETLDISGYPERFKQSWLHDELYQVCSVNAYVREIT